MCSTPRMATRPPPVKLRSPSPLPPPTNNIPMNIALYTKIRKLREEISRETNNKKQKALQTELNALNNMQTSASPAPSRPTSRGGSHKKRKTKQRNHKTKRHTRH